jgi:hypothetical protein
MPPFFHSADSFFNSLCLNCAIQTGIVKKEAWSDLASFQKMSSTSQTSPLPVHSSFRFPSDTGKDEEEQEDGGDNEHGKLQLDAWMGRDTFTDDDDSLAPLSHSAVPTEEDRSPSLWKKKTAETAGEDVVGLEMDSREPHHRTGVEQNGKLVANIQGRRASGIDGVRMISSLADSSEEDGSASDDDSSLKGDEDDSGEDVEVWQDDSLVQKPKLKISVPKRMILSIPSTSVRLTMQPAIDEGNYKVLTHAHVCANVVDDGSSTNPVGQMLSAGSPTHASMSIGVNKSTHYHHALKKTFVCVCVYVCAYLGDTESRVRWRKAPPSGDDGIWMTSEQNEDNFPSF